MTFSAFWTWRSTDAGTGFRCPAAAGEAANGDRVAPVSRSRMAHAGHEGERRRGPHKVQAMVGRIRLGQGRELARHFGPVELAAFHDHAAEGGAVAADELGGGFHNDVGAVLQRAEQVRGGEGVVHDHRQVVLVGDGGDGLEVGQVGVRVAEGLEVDELGVLLDGVLELLRVLGGDERWW